MPSEETLELHKRGDLGHPLKNSVADAVARANSSLSVIEQVRAFDVITEAFTVDNEMLTPTLKNRRHKISENYKDTIESLY